MSQVPRVGQWLLLAGVCLLPAAAGPASKPGSKSIRLAPGTITLTHPGASQRFIVEAVDERGWVSVLERDYRVVSSNPQVATADVAQGLIVGRAPGRATLTAKAQGLLSSVQVEVRNKPADVSVHFSPDIISILTIKGCNGSNCHGSPAGQAGFKLSLFGYDVEADHQMIVKAQNGRRVDATNAEESLLLKKPSFRSPHGGGRVMPADSQEYRTVLDWLKQGARLDAGGVRMTALEMYPAERVLLGSGARQQLAVIGRLSDGSTRDMTWEVRYTAGDEAVATVSTDGVVTSAGIGLTPVLARAMGQVAAAQIGVIAAAPDPRNVPAPARNFIDRLAFDKLYRMNVTPYPPSSDREFVRRVYLDAIGTLPTPEEVRTFVEATDAGKRAALIDSLLDRPEYALFWTVKFEDWFRNSQINSQGRSMGRFKEWTRDWLAADRPYDQVVRELLTSQGDTSVNPAANFWHPATDFMLKKFDVNKITPTVSRLFLGIRIECAECHNHPLENYTQDDFYGLAAFFAKLQVKHGVAEYRRTWFLDDEGALLHPVSKQPVQPKLLGAAQPEIAAGTDGRTILADWIVSPAHPQFARAVVNRIWNEYFQVGIVEPFDDFRSTNPPVNPALLDELARYWIAQGYRLKPLHRAILNTRLYQLSSVDHPGNRGDVPAAVERRLFARYTPRKLPAEVLLDAMTQVTGVAHVFANYPKGTRALEIESPDAPDYFLTTFGFPRRDVLAERSKSPTLSQALHLMNGSAVTRKVEEPENILSRFLTQPLPDAEIVVRLYERAYARPPSAQEQDRLLTYLAREGAQRGRRRALEGILWSILNSKEFQLNH